MEPKTSLPKFLDTALWVLLCLAAIGMPLIFDTHLINSVNVSKQAFLGVAVFLAGVIYIIRSLATRTFSLSYTVADAFVVALLVLGGLGTWRSVLPYESFMGRSEVFLYNFLFLLVSVGWYWWVVNSVHTMKRWQQLLDILVIVGGLTTLGVVLPVFFHSHALDSLLGAGIWSTVDVARSSLGVWFFSMVFLTAGLLLKKTLPMWRSVVYGATSLLSFVALVTVGFTDLWILLVCGAVIVCAAGINLRANVRGGWLLSVGAYLVGGVLLLILGAPTFMSKNVPAEVALNFKTSLNIAQGTLSSSIKNGILGSGPGTFGVDFSKMRTAAYNVDQLAWNLRFSRPRGSFVALATENGFLAPLLLLVYVILVGYVVITRWFSAVKIASRFSNLQGSFVTAPDMHWDMFAVGVTWILLTVGGIFIFYGPVIWWLWWTLGALLLRAADTMDAPVVRSATWEATASTGAQIFLSIVGVAVLVGAVWCTVWGVRAYSAERTYGEALRSAKYDEALKSLVGAAAARPGAAQYQRALAQLFILEAGLLSQNTSTPPQQIGTLLGAAIASGRQATVLGPQDVVNWENLATVYENIAVVIPDVRAQVIASLEKVRELEPTNPIVVWRLGNTYALLSQWDKAIAQYQAAIALKNNYADAYASLSAVYEQQNKMDQAIQAFQPLLKLVGNNQLALFNYGRLLYNRNKGDDRAGAEQVWRALVQAQPDYSNALYSLGLLYESRGDVTTAITYYKRVAQLNPTNLDVKAKINNLLSPSPTPVPAGPLVLPSSTPVTKPK